MPTGPGLLFEKRGDLFNIKSMHHCEKQSSLMAVEWLEYENARAQINYPGLRIQHALNGGEKVVSGFHVDGYVEIPMADGTMYTIAYEFMEKD